MALKFIIDTQLPPALKFIFKKHGMDAIHTSEFPRGHLMNDKQIKEIAVKQSRIVVTKDNDFFESYFLTGAPPKVLLIEIGNSRNAKLFRFIEDRIARVKKIFANDKCDLIVLEKEMIIVY